MGLEQLASASANNANAPTANAFSCRSTDIVLARPTMLVMRSHLAAAQTIRAHND
jgi:hypothetical protein